MTDDENKDKPKLIRRMVIMLACVALLFGAVFGFEAFRAHMIRKYMASAPPPPVAVSAIRAAFQVWKPSLTAVGSLRAMHGVDVTSEISGLVQAVHFASGGEAPENKLLVQLNADTETAQLQSLEAACDLARTVLDRDRKQYAVKAVSKAVLDAAAADLKVKEAQVAEQRTVIGKKAIRAPFAGRLGISSVNPGQYINPGQKIVTLQSLDPIYVDFYLPQQEFSRISLGQGISASNQTWPGRTFKGIITAMDPLVDVNTRNIQVEATLDNPEHLLLPGMYASVEVSAGRTERYITLPKTVVTFNPYGITVYLIEEKGRDKNGKPILIARQAFVTVGPSRGDQVAIIKGLQEGELVVTSGQQKLKSGARIFINNRVQPSNEAAPNPVEE